MHVSIATLLTLMVLAEPNPRFLFPSGAPAGSTVRVSAAGIGNDPKLRLVSPILEECRQIEPSDDEPLRSAPTFEIRLNKDIVAGVYPVWARTTKEIGQPLPFVVDSILPLETPTVNADTPVILPCVVDGLLQGNETDRFRFEAVKGQRLSLDAWAARLGSAIDARIVVRRPDRGILAECEDSPGLNGDCRLIAEIPVSGTYMVEIHDTTYSVSRVQPYRLRIGGDFAEEISPLEYDAAGIATFSLAGGTFAKPETIEWTPSRVAASTPLSWKGQPLGAVRRSELPVIDESARSTPISVPASVRGRITSPGETDRWRFMVPGDQKLSIRVHASASGSRLDAVLTVKGRDEKTLLKADDQFLKTRTDARRKTDVGYNVFDPAGTFVVKGGSEVEVEIRDRTSAGGIGYPYALVIEPAESAFELSVDRAQAVVQRGGKTELEARIQRLDGRAAIRFSAVDAPNGWTCEGAIEEGKDHGVIRIAVPADATADVGFLRLIGTTASGPPRSRPVLCEREFGADDFEDREILPRQWSVEQIAIVVAEPTDP